MTLVFHKRLMFPLATNKTQAATDIMSYETPKLLSEEQKAVAKHN